MTDAAHQPRDCHPPPSFYPRARTVLAAPRRAQGGALEGYGFECIPATTPSRSARPPFTPTYMSRYSLFDRGRLELRELVVRGNDLLRANCFPFQPSAKLFA